MKALRRLPSIFYLSIFLVGLISVLFVLNEKTTQQTKENLESIKKELKPFQEKKLNDEKIRQETIGLQLQNEAKTSFLGNFATTGAIFVAFSGLFGAGVGALQYLRLRRADHLANATTQLNQLWEGLASQDDEKVASSIAGLQQFLISKYEEFHARIAGGLALSSRREDKTRIVRKTLRPVLEQAIRIIEPETMRNISWQGMKLHYVNFSGRDLRKFDYHESIIQHSNFSKAKLQEARFENSILRGCIFDGADLTGVNFENADLRGASFKKSILVNVNFRNSKVLGMDLEEARLGGNFLETQWHSMNWIDCKNWRLAKFDTSSVRDELIKKYGPQTQGPRVLMLMWEFLPVVTGGGWTAAYHLIRKLREQGSQITILVPWLECLDSYPFGYEVKIISASIKAEDCSAYSGYSAYSEYGLSQERSRSLFYQVNYFTNRVKKISEEQQLEFDIIHAHDWLTFNAAKFLAEKHKKPWIAHFHSCEQDRRPQKECSVEITSIEQEAFQSAVQIIVPSKVLKNKLLKLYSNMGTSQFFSSAILMGSETLVFGLVLVIIYDFIKVNVIPNSISAVDINSERLGVFSSGQVIFVGRLSWQKDPGAFLKIASGIKEVRPDTKFIMYGEGDLEKTVATLIEKMSPPEPIKFHPWEFRFDFKRIKPIISYKQEIKEIASQVATLLKIKGTETCTLSLLWVMIVEKCYSSKQLAEIPETLRQSEQNKILEKKFSIIPIQCQHPYTHKVRVKLKKRFSEYLVQIDENLLPKYEDNSQKFVVMNGHVNWEKRALAYENATVLVVTSWNEPFGMVVLEAMQHGVPVMFPKDAGVAEVLNSDISFNPRDTQAAKEILLRLLEDEAYWYEVVNRQLEDVTRFREKHHERSVSRLWSQLEGDFHIPAKAV